MTTLAPYVKALTGGLVSGLTSAATALTDGIVTPVEWVTIALAFILGTGVVYAVPNYPKDQTTNRTENT